MNVHYIIIFGVSVKNNLEDCGGSDGKPKPPERAIEDNGPMGRPTTYWTASG